MRLILILLLTSLSYSAYSSTVFEPSLSLGVGGGERSISGTTGAAGSSNGTLASFGFRYGITRRYIHVTGLFEGNILMAGEAKNNTSTIEATTHFSSFLGLGIGYEWNIPLRTYLIFGAYNGDTDFSGSGFELAYYLNERYWIGLRYLGYNDKIKQELTVGTTTSEIETVADYNVVSLIFSFPFEFNYPDHWFRKTDWQ